MLKIPTLYTNYQELLLDLDIFGRIMSESLVKKDELKVLLFEEYKLTHPLPTLEDKRYELSDLVSSDYHITYGNEVELAENEHLIDLGLSNDTDTFEFNGNIVVPQALREHISYSSNITDTIREQLIKDFITNDLEELTAENVEKIEGVFNTVKDNSVVVDMNITYGLNENEEYEFDDTYSDDEEYTSDDEEYTSDDEEYTSDDEEYASEDEEYNTEDEEYGGDMYSSDDVNYTSDDDEYTSDDEEYNTEDEEYASDDEEYASEDEEYNTEDEEYNSDDEYTSDDEEYNTEDDAYTSDDGEYTSEDEEYASDDGEYTSEDEEYASDDEEYATDDEYTSDDEEYFFDASSSLSDEKETNKGGSSSQVNVSHSEVSNDSYRTDFTPVPTPVDMKNRNEEAQPKVEIQESKPTINREDEPKDLKEFIRKHPRCEVSFALQYFSRKEIEKNIMLGKVIKKGSKLHI